MPRKANENELYRERYRRFGLKVAYYRKLAGMTQEMLAEAAQISWSTLSQIEANDGNRVRGVSFNMLFKLSDALEISPAQLFESSVGS